MSANRPFVLSIAGFDPSAGAGVLAVVLGFRPATGTVVILGDAGAINADWLVTMGSRPAGEHAFCPAAGAGAVGAHGDREAGPADPAFRPAGTVLTG